MTTDYKINKETAEQEFERMCQAFRIDLDALGQEDADWSELRNRIVLDIRSGSLVVGTDGKPTYTPIGGGTSVTFRTPTGATFMALETYGKGKDISNMIAAMEEMTQSGKGTFAKMARVDFNSCVRLARLFLADL